MVNIFFFYLNYPLKRWFFFPNTVNATNYLNYFIQRNILIKLHLWRNIKCMKYINLFFCVWKNTFWKSVWKDRLYFSISARSVCASTPNGQVGVVSCWVRSRHFLPTCCHSVSLGPHWRLLWEIGQKQPLKVSLTVCEPVPQIRRW